MAKDNARYLDAVQRMGGKLSKTESLTGLVSTFEQEVDLATAAAELGLRPAEFSEKLAESVRLLRLLGSLRVPGGTVQRQVFTSAFRELIEDLKLGRLVTSGS